MCRIEKEFLAKECGVDESEVYNSYTDEYLAVRLANDKSRKQILEEIEKSPSNNIFARALEIQKEKGWL